MPVLHWDIFCEVVDNLGDVGVCWRLAAQLGASGHRVRLFIDVPEALAWMAPEGAAGVAVHASLPPGDGYIPADVVIAAFGCKLAPEVIAAIQSAGRGGRRIPWIHLEYLSAEAYVAASHGLESPVLGGAGEGVHRWFYFPGFTPDTGGVLREPDLAERQARFDRQQWLAQHGVHRPGASGPDEAIVSLFCYEPPSLATCLMAWSRNPIRLLVTAGRAAEAVRTCIAQMPAHWNDAGRLQLHFLPRLTQRDYDHLLWACDFNCVRGEDSLVRAIHAGTGLLWQAYPQADGAHAEKIEAFLDWMGAPQALRSLHRLWNGEGPGPDGSAERGLAVPPEIPVLDARRAVRDARDRLWAQTDLAARLVQFVTEKR